jgi:hypothetical protein
MTLNEYLAAIYSAEFVSNVNLASGDATAFSIVLSSPQVREFVGSARKEPSIIGQVLREIRAISQRPIDPRYQSPHDVPLLALLIAVEQAAPRATQLAGLLVQRAPQTWWAARHAQRVLAERAPNAAATFDTPPTSISSPHEILLIAAGDARNGSFLVAHAISRTPLSGSFPTEHVRQAYASSSTKADFKEVGRAAVP